jgi:glyoxylase-like metal-dependent hydrolase (beta-lactamase superfamily II)
MNKDFYRFKVGNYECMAVSDGGFTYAPPNFPPPGPFLFANAPPVRLAQALRRYDLTPEKWQAWTSDYTCLLVNTGRNLVLIDTGAGSLAPSTGKLVPNLRAAGVMTGDIDTVINTHAHPDHLGGNTSEDGKPAFPSARYYLWKGEWDFWTSGEAERKLDAHSRPVLMGFANRNLLPIRDRLELVGHEADIVPGIRAVAAPGHTPGHMALVVSSQNEQLLCVSDAVLHPVHLEKVEWRSVFDLSPELLGDTRRRLLEEAAAGNMLVMAFHFPFPGLGKVIKVGNAWKWRPANIAASP